MSRIRTERRKSRIVDPARQTRIVVAIAALPLAVLSVAAVVMYALTQRLFDEAQGANAELPSLGWLSVAQFLFVVLTGAFAVIQALRYSHKVVGPAQRICGALRRVRAGQTGFRIEFRRGDELGMIADELNLLLEEIERQQCRGSAPASAPALVTTVGCAADVD